MVSSLAVALEVKPHPHAIALVKILRIISLGLDSKEEIKNSNKA